MRLHAIVEDLGAARAAVEGGATVVQLRRKGASTVELVDAGQGFAELGALFVVNDNVEAAVLLGANGVHLGRGDEGAERAIAAGLLLGRSAASVAEALDGERQGAAYLGAGPVWATPSTSASWVTTSPPPSSAASCSIPRARPRRSSSASRRVSPSSESRIDRRP